MSVMRVIVLHPFTKLEVRRPSCSEDIWTVVLSCVAVNRGVRRGVLPPPPMASEKNVF